MRNRVFPAVLVSAALAFCVAASAQSPASFIVHEWGTFTSIAAANGEAVQWVPIAGRSDLPCFVERSGTNQKISTVGTVRMETPVLYFYSPRALDASVHVDFPQGLVTEWYPHATMSAASSNVGGQISWPVVSVQPGAKTSFPTEDAPSHYYAARNTDADPLRVGAKPEKFLFYRGVGQFQPPISAVAREDGGVDVKNRRGQPIGDLVYFENRRGSMTFGATRLTAASSVVPRPSLDDASGAPIAELQRILIANGLYAREAEAMVNTWKDSWFEEGARLLYVVSRADVDAILPLTISPKPSAVARVFVGRIEVMTPATLHDVRAAIESGDRAVMLKYGRFLSPIAERLGLAGRLTSSIYASVPPSPLPACGR